jgi:ribose transport system permease protein
MRALYVSSVRTSDLKVRPLYNASIGAVTRIPPSYIVFIILLGALAALRPNLMAPSTLAIFARQVVPLGILVLGQLLVISCRSIDLSGGGIILLVNYLISSGHLASFSPVTVVALCLVTGLAVGLLNGLLVAKRRVSAVIVTLAVGTILVGTVQYLASARPPGEVPSVYREIYNSRLAGMPVPLIVWVALATAMSFVVSKSVYGRFVLSIGSNPISAHFSGVPVQRTVVIAHALAGLMGAAAGLVQTSAVAIGSARAGPELVMNSIAATILGGVIFGRSPGVWGPFFGVLSFALLFVLLTAIGVQEAGKLVAQGVIILLAAILYGIRSRS